MVAILVEMTKDNLLLFLEKERDFDKIAKQFKDMIIEHITYEACDDYNQHKKERSEFKSKWSGVDPLNELYKTAENLIEAHPSIFTVKFFDDKMKKIQLDLNDMCDGFSPVVLNLSSYREKLVQDKIQLECRNKRDVKHTLDILQSRIEASLSAVERDIANNRILHVLEYAKRVNALHLKSKMRTPLDDLIDFTSVYDMMSSGKMDEAFTSRKIYVSNVKPSTYFEDEFFIMADKYIIATRAIIERVRNLENAK